MLSLAALEHAPAQLAQQADRVQLEIEELAVTNFRTFIESTSLIQHVSGSLSQLATNAAAVSQQLPKLATACDRFLERSTQWRQQRRLNRLMTDVWCYRYLHFSPVC